MNGFMMSFAMIGMCCVCCFLSSYIQVIFYRENRSITGQPMSVI